jgi:hydroxymethylpyrimidine/phosphomethylpyrimidine kinase
MRSVKTVLTIAGSDCSGGAGIQADLKTITAHGLYGETVVTALTAQNTMGVRSIHPTAPAFIAEQLNAVFEEARPDAIKIGMMFNAEIICIVAEYLRKNNCRNLVIDPVLISTSGRELLAPEAVGLLKRELFPIASLVTPNIPEAQVLSGVTIKSQLDMETAARLLNREYGAAFLIKGGHMGGSADDLLWEKDVPLWYRGERLQVSNTHGTGCTLSSAIACRLAMGDSMYQAVEFAKRYLTDCLNVDFAWGKGNGPLWHFPQIFS